MDALAIFTRQILSFNSSKVGCAPYTRLGVPSFTCPTCTITTTEIRCHCFLPKNATPFSLIVGTITAARKVLRL